MGKGRIDVWKTIQIRLSQLHHIQLLITFKFVIFCWFFNFFQKKIILTTPFAWDFIGYDLFFIPYGIYVFTAFLRQYDSVVPLFHLRFFDLQGNSCGDREFGVGSGWSHGKSLRNLGDFCTPNKHLGVETLFLFTQKKTAEKKNTKKKVGFIRTCNWSTTGATCGE